MSELSEQNRALIARLEDWASSLDQQVEGDRAALLYDAAAAIADPPPRSAASFSLIAAWTESGIRDQPQATRWTAFEAGWNAAREEGRQAAEARSKELEAERDALKEGLSTCAWQLEMLAGEWGHHLPGAIRLQCDVKAKLARSLLKDSSNEGK